MKTTIVSYSLTGRNEILSKRVAIELGVKHILVKEEKERKIGTTIMDLIFNRTPKVIPTPDALGTCEMLILFAPIWMGNAATPLRSYLKHIKNNKIKYAFATVSGGALGKNPELIHTLKKTVGYNPEVLIDLYVADLLEKEKLTSEETQNYKISDKEFESLTKTMVESLKKIIAV